MLQHLPQVLVSGMSGWKQSYLPRTVPVEVGEIIVVSVIEKQSALCS